MRPIVALLLYFFTAPTFAQVLSEVQGGAADSLQADLKYREDQFYASVSYNLMQGKPGGYSQNSFSTALTTGFLRDMPVNDARTSAIAIGLGYSYNNIQHNLKVSESGGKRSYEIVPEADFDKNKLVLHYVDLPIEFRWRNSTPYSHKFWRIYAGFKISYLFADKAQFDFPGGGSMKVKGNDDLNKFVYGAYISAGWNTWNLYAYYGITPLFKESAKIPGGQNVNLNSLHLGLMFYIL